MTIQMDAIASVSSASWYHSGTPKLSCKQCLCIYKAPCLARACWAQPKPVVLHRADAGFAFLQNALSALRRNARPPQNRDYIQTSKFTRQNFNLVYEFGLYANKSTVCYGHVFGESGQEVFHLHCKSDNVFCRNKLIL